MESRLLNKTMDFVHEIKFTKEELDELDCHLSSLEGYNSPIIYNDIPVGVVTNVEEMDDETIEVSYSIWIKFCHIIPKEFKLTFCKNYDDYYRVEACYIE